MEVSLYLSMVMLLMSKKFEFLKFFCSVSCFYNKIFLFRRGITDNGRVWSKNYTFLDKSMKLGTVTISHISKKFMVGATSN